MIDFIAFWSNPKVRRMDRIAGAVRSLTLFLQWCVRHRPDGVLSAGDNIELMADWDHEQGVFVSLLEAAELIKKEGMSYRVVDWLGFDLEFRRKASRSGKARLSRMAKIHPDIYADLCRQGIREITREDYEVLTKNNERSTNVQCSLEHAPDRDFHDFDESGGAGDRKFFQRSPKVLNDKEFQGMEKSGAKEKEKRTKKEKENINNIYINPGDFVDLLPEDDILAKVLIEKLKTYNSDFIEKNKVRLFTREFAKARVAGLPMLRAQEVIGVIFSTDAKKHGVEWARRYITSPLDLLKWWDKITLCLKPTDEINTHKEPAGKSKPLTPEEIQAETDRVFA